MNGNFAGKNRYYSAQSLGVHGSVKPGPGAVTSPRETRQERLANIANNEIFVNGLNPGVIS